MWIKFRTETIKEKRKAKIPSLWNKLSLLKLRANWAGESTGYESAKARFAPVVLQVLTSLIHQQPSKFLETSRSRDRFGLISSPSEAPLITGKRTRLLKSIAGIDTNELGEVPRDYNQHFVSRFSSTSLTSLYLNALTIRNYLSIGSIAGFLVALLFETRLQSSECVRPRWHSQWLIKYTSRCQGSFRKPPDLLQAVS